MMLRSALLAVVAVLLAPVAGLKPPVVSRRSVFRAAAGGSVAAAAIWTNPLASQATIDTEQVTLDVNNAGADAFKSLKGLYPTIATKVIQRGPFKTAEEMYKAMDSDVERERLQQYEKLFEFGKRGYADRATASRML